MIADNLDTLWLMDLKDFHYEITNYSFSSPRIGDSCFSDFFTRLNNFPDSKVKSYRIYGKNDPVRNFPNKSCYKHAGEPW